MFRNAALILLGAIIANVPQADAAVTDETACCSPAAILTWNAGER